MEIQKQEIEEQQIKTEIDEIMQSVNKVVKRLTEHGLLKEKSKEDGIDPKKRSLTSAGDE